tara:strand:- start:299 stop:496 length:198 start_codon:yes stop_codon:yes gene_type:complete
MIINSFFKKYAKKKKKEEEEPIIGRRTKLPHHHIQPVSLNNSESLRITIPRELRKIVEEKRACQW